MTNTKWLSALLAGTALTVAATAAMADSSLVTMTRNAAGEGVTFSIAPTADMPAAATEVSIAGEVRGRILMNDANGEASESDMNSRTRIVIKGNTETAVGAVGAYARLESSNGDHFTGGKTYGYWQMAPEWQLLAGRTDSIGAIEAGIDWNFDGSLTGNVGGPTNSTRMQTRLTYGTGPMTVALAVQDASPGDMEPSQNSSYEYGAAVKFSAGNGVDVSVAGVSAEADDDTTGYFIGAGANFAMGSIATATAAVGFGSGEATGSSYISLDSDEDFTSASIGLSFNVAEGTQLQTGYGVTKGDIQGSASDVTAALLWSPVGQLTLGAGVGYESGDATDKLATAGLGAWFKF